MASGIFAVLDDIAALMDDVAITSKIAGRKTAAILGDDLAVNYCSCRTFIKCILSRNHKIHSDYGRNLSCL